MTILDDFRRDAERVLDRLVDGELSPADRRELLAGLDDEPGGWRRCALAFLEAQTWRWQLTRAATEPILAQVAVPRTERATRRGARWGGLLAIAAGLLVAFLLGTRFPATEPSTGPIADRPSQPIAPGALVQADPGRQTGAPQKPWQTVTLTPVGDSSGTPIQLRVATDGADPKSPAAGARSALSALLARSFEQGGWKVNRHQGVMPIDLADGRQLLVPIEEIDLRTPDDVQF